MVNFIREVMEIVRHGNFIKGHFQEVTHIFISSSRTKYETDEFIVSNLFEEKCNMNHKQIVIGLIT